MPRLPVTSGAQVVKALMQAGFVVIRVKGSHHAMRHPDGRNTSVPVHGSQDLPPGTLRAILRQTELTVAEFSLLL